jgi:hypothetical protein
MWINPNTGKGWTDDEEATFAEIMRITGMERIAAIQLFRRCKSNAVKAINVARRNCGLSDAQVAVHESVKAARLAALSKARQTLAQNRAIRQSEVTA